MPSVSKAQQKLFGAVYNCKKTGKCSGKVKDVANSISTKDARDFAKFREYVEIMDGMYETLNSQRA